MNKSAFCFCGEKVLFGAHHIISEGALDRLVDVNSKLAIIEILKKECHFSIVGTDSYFLSPC